MATTDLTWTTRQRAMLREMGLRGFPLAQRSPAATQAAVNDRVQEPAQAPALDTAAAPPTAAIAPITTVASVSVALTPLPQPTAPTGGLGWAELKAAVSACQACRLCEGRTQTVFGAGPTQAHWLVVGEAPGEEEDRRGEPFVGKSGQLLDAMLQSLGLSRSSGTPAERAVYIANAVKCRPPGNRNPQPDELARCEPFLLRQVSLLQPRLILAMGRFAVQSLLRSDEPIGRLRTSTHHYQGVPLVVTYHPAYLLRSPMEKARAWDDLCRARALAGSTDGHAATRPTG